MSDVNTVGTRAHEFVCADHIAPNPGSSVMPDPVEYGLAKYARNDLVWNAMWSAYFDLESNRIHELRSQMELENKDHSHEIGFAVLQPCPREQWFALLAHAIQTPEEVYPIVDNTFGKMVDLEIKREKALKEQMKAESDMHHQLMSELGVDDLVQVALARLKDRPNLFERKSVIEYREAIKGMIGISERGSYDWLKIPIWAQAKIALSVMRGMSFESAKFLDKLSKSPATATYMKRFQPQKFEECQNLAKTLAEYRKHFQLAHQQADVSAEIASAVEANRLKEFEVEYMIQVLG